MVGEAQMFLARELGAAAAAREKVRVPRSEFVARQQARLPLQPYIDQRINQRITDLELRTKIHLDISDCSRAMDQSHDSRRNGDDNEPELSPLEQEVLDEYANLVVNLDNVCF